MQMMSHGKTKYPTLLFVRCISCAFFHHTQTTLQPTFDPETEAELKKLRVEREEKLKERQAKLKEKWLAEKAREDAERQAEVKVGHCIDPC